MPKRTKYGFNSQWVNIGRFNDLLPLGYIEMVPGDTLSGKINVRSISAPTNGVIYNRAFNDISAYYIPYRLLFDGFPDFITQGIDTSEVIPTVTNAFPQNFEKHSVVHSAFQRFAYNLISNKFYRRNDVAERAEDAVGSAVVSFRPTTFHNAVPEGPHEVTTIDTSGPTTNTDVIREAMNQDRFRKVREYYGDRYVDYLAALGVKTNWSILEEPELLKRKNGTMRFNIIDPTTSDVTGGIDPDDAVPQGRPGGYFTQEMSFDLGRVFAPEHGLVCFMTTPKFEPQRVSGDNPSLYMTQPEDFWSPEHSSMLPHEYSEAIWLGVTGLGTVELPRWEHLRKGVNLSVDDQQGFFNYSYMEDTTTVDAYKTLDKMQIDDLFQDVVGTIPGTALDTQIIFTADHQLVKHSPVANRTNRPLV